MDLTTIQQRLRDGHYDDGTVNIDDLLIVLGDFGC